MGYYVNIIDGIQLGPSYREKCKGLIDAGAKETNGEYFEKDLVCVVDNGWMAAAGYAYDESEYEQFRREDSRPKRWFILKNAQQHVD